MIRAIALSALVTGEHVAEGLGNSPWEDWMPIYKYDVDGLKVAVEPHERIRTYFPNGWYQHDWIYVGGKFVGRVQTRRRNKREDVITCADIPIPDKPIYNQSCVLGRDYRWLVRLVQESGLDKIPRPVLEDYI